MQAFTVTKLHSTNLNSFLTVIWKVTMHCINHLIIPSKQESYAEQIMFSTEDVNKLVDPDESVSSRQRNGREPTAKKPKINLQERGFSSLHTPCNNKVWSILECQLVIANYTNPVGKVTMNERQTLSHKF